MSEIRYYASKSIRLAPSPPTAEEIARMKAWQQPEIVKPKRKRKRTRRAPDVAWNRPEDTSPAHIRRLREAYCANFIKTGELDADMVGRLRAYAEEKKNERRRHLRSTQGVSAEHASDRQIAAASSASRDDGDRTHHQIGAGAARRIYELLRA